MSPITHFLVGWTALERAVPARRDKALVSLAGVAPDLDGLGIVFDFATRRLGMPETDYYQAYHRIYGHGLPAAFVIAAVCAALATRGQRAVVALCAFAAVHTAGRLMLLVPVAVLTPAAIALALRLYKVGSVTVLD